MPDSAFFVEIESVAYGLTCAIHPTIMTSGWDEGMVGLCKGSKVSLFY